MKNFFAYFLASFTGFIAAGIILTLITVIVFSGVIASMSEDEVTIVEPNSILYISLDQEITDRGSDNPMANLNLADLSMSTRLGLYDIIENILKAQKDDNIKGIFIELGQYSAGIATLNELRDALLQFKESKKFIYCYSELYTQGGYYLASSADSIFINPEGSILFAGLSAEVMFYKGALDKLGIETEIIRHGKFKSAVEPFTLDKMSPENREQTMKYVGTIWEQLLTDIGEQRNLTVAELNRFADELIIQNPDSAVKYSLIDRSAYRDEVISSLKKKIKIKQDEDLKLIAISDYTSVPKKRDEKNKGFAKEKIAIIFASGSIGMGGRGSESIESDVFAKAIREARKDKSIKAVVLRVNSPGGSALASEVIWREIDLTRLEKPVIASFGDVAASGGYYIACNADTIVASPTTITGSIGVFGIIPNFEKVLNEKLGITIDQVNTNKHSDILSLTRKMAPEERQVIQNNIEEIYQTFITHVAEGRDMTVASIDSIGQGRVWSGVNAKEIGLIDEFGGLQKAIQIAAGAAKLTNYRIVKLPKKKSPIEQIMSDLTGGKSDPVELYLEKQFGENAKYFNVYRQAMELKGIQARLPYFLDVH